MRLRFAPSPTGYLHIGNARTALFNYLLAKKHQGRFILRIEDTDIARSKKEFEAGIIEDLRWLGLNWDEGPDKGGDFGPYRQSERLKTYQEFAEKLLKENKAYHCYCTKEELDQRNKELLARKESPRYDNRCRNLSDEQKKKYLEEGRKPVIRFKIPEKTIEVNDLIRGKVSFDTKLMGDFIIMKSDGKPAFNFAVVVDDILMRITTVIRGEDHLSNTPRHIMLFEALNSKIPEFAHMAMTMGPDGSRLSKRHGATSIREYRKLGMLPEALFNYLALLGWGSKKDQEIFTKEELIKEFSLERCKEGAAIFDPEKLTWMNGLYIRKKKPQELAKLSIPYLEEKGLREKEDYLIKVIALERERIKKLSEIPDLIEYFLVEKIKFSPEALLLSKKPEVKEILTSLKQELENLSDFSAASLEKIIREWTKNNGLKTKDVFHPLRVAITGRTIGPGLFETMEVLGKEKVIQRLMEVLC
ncbi:MAG: glutamate--tRNA ligase [bacterium (Candidatus Ratteibacteria) CG_4_9_14_3_um_filter_41_21]|uniref:Glutamate--tRNA ligase n=1 Tax=bacterium (Candidatus Ratteibacteria) CG_4_9_14_3_um_filter_41_21 TaxID=2014289 RepID=A0A2M7YFP2_9BACT|nr:MAG: glutamate--tRNA ligase [bacterium (Candidatus Ratteibacteria) CG_4_9_14_3_um_filter_41_21]